MAEECSVCGYHGTRAIVGAACPQCGGVVLDRRPPPPPIKPGTGIPVIDRVAAASGDGELELDPAWIAERAARRSAPAPKRRRAPIAGIVVAVLVIALVGVGVYTLATRTAAAPAKTIDGPGVSIRIIAVGAREVSIDGRYIGKTPLTLNMPRSAQPILITAPDVPPRQIIPDRNQVVNLSGNQPR